VLVASHHLVGGSALVRNCVQFGGAPVGGNALPVVVGDSAPELTAENLSPRLNGYAVAMGERDAAQAAVLIRALSELRDKMIDRMTWLEKHDRQSDATALRRDVNEAQAHITRLHRHYLGRDIQAPQSARQAR
jgi:hypothetical protein